MSVLIKGMEMPQNCFDCLMSSFGLCNLIEGEPIGIPSKRLDNCPLIELPPHGRLGDLDRLEQMFVDIDNAPYSGFDGTEPFYSAEDAAQIIRLAPTIIQAEEGE